MSWVKWYRNKTVWVIIITGLMAMVGAFLCAYYLPFPYNLIGAIACCIPGGIIIRKGIIKALESSINTEKN